MSKTRLASSVIMTRGHDHAPEIFLVKRAPQLRFMGGYWAFPGGTLLEEDYPPGDDSEDIAFIRCALRELFEETGILSGNLDSETNPGIRNRIRQDLLRKESSLESWLELVNNHRISIEDVEHICSITTPPISPVLYKTRFMHVPLPEGEEPSIEPGELVEGRFFKPAEAVAAWDRGEIQIAPPNLFLLRLMAEHDLPAFKQVAAEKTGQFSAGALHPVYFSPGLFMAPLRTPTLPPATTTNTYIVGLQTLYVIDPATPYEDEQKRLFAKMDELTAEGKTFAGILLTHHHSDHTGAVSAVSQRYRLPVRAHELTYSRLKGSYISGKPLNEGDRVELGHAADGSPDWHLQVLYTPGHAADHLCYFDSRFHGLIAGDMLSTLSTIVIDPPEGHMQTYLDSLNRLLGYPVSKLYPAHGPVHDHGEKLIRKYIEHRKDREQAVIKALMKEPQQIDQILTKVYNDVPEKFQQIASRSLLAGLIKLQEDGICEENNSGWYLI